MNYIRQFQYPGIATKLGLSDIVLYVDVAIFYISTVLKIQKCCVE